MCEETFARKITLFHTIDQCSTWNTTFNVYKLQRFFYQANLETKFFSVPSYVCLCTLAVCSRKHQLVIFIQDTAVSQLVSSTEVAAAGLLENRGKFVFTSIRIDSNFQYESYSCLPKRLFIEFFRNSLKYSVILSFIDKCF